MKIAYNPTTAAALTAAPSNNDITFDLKGIAIYARGVKFKGTDTTYSVFKKHTTSGNTGGSNGLVPVPSYTTTKTRFLREDGTWVVPTDSNYTTHLYVGAKDDASNDITTNGITYIKLFDDSILRNLYLIKGAGNTSVTSDENGNITINSPTTIAWGNITGKPSTFTPSSHTHPTSQVTTLTGYVKATTAKALVTEDSLNTALGKLEYKLDIAYDLVTKANDKDGTIENLKEILDVLAGIKDTETIKALVGKYLPLAGGTMTLGEGLKFHADENYFGTNLDARIISLLDGNGTTCDGGLIIDERCTSNGTTTITELLRIRDTEFKWKGLNILHSGNSSVSGGGSTWGSTLTVTINGVSKTLTIPSNPNVDTKVTLTITTTNADYRVLFSANANDTTETTTARKAANLKFNPSTGTLTATIFNGTAAKVTCIEATSDNDRPIVGTNKSDLLYYTTKATVNLKTGIIKAVGFLGNLIGGAKGSLIYQTSGTTTAFLTAPTTNDYVLKYNTSTGAPYWAADNNTTYDLLINGSLAFTPAEAAITNDNLNSNHLKKTVSIVRGSWSYAKNGYTVASTWGNIDLAGTTIIKVGDSTSTYTQLFITANTATTTSALKGEVLYYIDNGDNYTPTWYRVLTNANYTSYVNTTDFPGLNKTGTVTSVTVTGANGLSGSGTVTTSGTITLSNAGVRSTTINGNYLRVNTNGTNADLTIPYATKAKSLINYYSSRPTSIDPGVTGDGDMFQFKCTSSVTNTATDPGDGHILHFNWDNTGGYDALLFLPTSSSALKVRGMSSGTWLAWATVLTNLNYTSYLGYIGTTAVLKSSAALALTGITTATFSGAVTLSGTASNTAILKFSRSGASTWNYIIWPGNTNADCKLAFGYSNSSDASYYYMTSASFNSVANNARSLGTSSVRWSNVYSVLGNFSGLITATSGILIGNTADIGWYLSNSRICAGNSTARGVNVGSLLVSNAWADYSKVPTNGIYSKGNILTARGLVVGTTIFLNTGDPTLKIYSGEITNAKSDGNICFLTCIDGLDGLSHSYAVDYQARNNIVLQPRGGQVYIGTNPDGGNTGYKLYVNGKIFSTGFVKSGSSDSYVLLGGGSHKALSEFLLESEVLTNNLTTFTKSLTVTLAWMDTGIKYQDLPATGTYIVLVYVSNANNSTGSMYYCYWSGVMSWYRDGTNDTEPDEILLHRSGHAYGNTIYLRTIMTASSDGRHLRLQIAANKDLGAAYTYTFKFKRII